jgi:hypothetical protein
MVPTCLRSGEKIHTPRGPALYRLPFSSTFIPSGPPAAFSELASKKSFPSSSDPSSASRISSARNCPHIDSFAPAKKRFRWGQIFDEKLQFLARGRCAGLLVYHIGNPVKAVDFQLFVRILIALRTQPVWRIREVERAILLNPVATRSTLASGLTSESSSGASFSANALRWEIAQSAIAVARKTTGTKNFQLFTARLHIGSISFLFDM